MNDDIEPEGTTSGYEPPKVVRLGSLAELTQGGTTGLDDAMSGGAGDQGSGL